MFIFLFLLNNNSQSSSKICWRTTDFTSFTDFETFCHVILIINGNLKLLEFKFFSVNIFLSFCVHCHRSFFFKLNFSHQFFSPTGFHRSPVVISIPLGLKILREPFCPNNCNHNNFAWNGMPYPSKLTVKILWKFQVLPKSSKILCSSLAWELLEVLVNVILFYDRKGSF